MAFPSVAASAVSNRDTAANPVIVDLPAGISAGDLLLVRLRSPTAGSWTVPSGWTELFANQIHGSASGDRDFFAYRIANGSEGSTLSVTNANSVKAAAIALRITGWHGTTPPEISTAATGASTAPDPASLTPSWGAADTLWLWVGGWEGRQTSPPAGNPTNYSGVLGADTGTATNNASNCRVAIATRQLNATSEDPPSWTISISEDWVAHTVAIRPAAAGGGDITGTATTTVPAPTSAAAGREVFAATAAAAIPAPTSAAQVAQAFVAESAVDLPAPTSAGQAVETFAGSAATDVPAPTSEATAFEAFTAAAAVGVPAPSSAAEATYTPVGIVGSVAVDVPAPTSDASAREVFAGSLEASIPAPTSEAEAAYTPQAISGAVDVDIPAPTSTGQAGLTFVASLEVAVPAPTSSAEATTTTEGFVGSIDVAIPAPTSAAEALYTPLAITGEAAGSIPAPTSQAEALQAFIGAAAADILAPTSGASAGQRFAATIAVLMAAPTSSASAAFDASGVNILPRDAHGSVSAVGRPSALVGVPAAAATAQAATAVAAATVTVPDSPSGEVS